MIDFEAIEVALFENIKTQVLLIPGVTFRRIERTAQIYATTGIENQPALFLIPFGGQTTQDQAFGIMKYLLEYSVLVYTRAEEGSKKIPQTLLNQCWAAVDTALRGKPPGQKQTLDGLVENAWIEGQITMQPGILDQQCALEIPIRAITAI